MTTPDPIAPVVRRTRLSPFIPPTPPDPTPALIARDSLRAGGRTPQLSRNRKIAGDLPDWEPLPPGEVRVTRRSSSSLP